jgi:hypothetical protein
MAIITKAQKPTVPKGQATSTADLIARLELAKRALRNIGDGDVEPHAKLIGEAQAALAAQAPYHRGAARGHRGDTDRC